MDGLTDERLIDSHRIRGPCQLSHLSNMLGEISWKPFAKGKRNKCVYFFLLANGFWLLFVKMREKLPRIRWHCLSTGAVGTQNQRRELNDFIWFYSTLFIFIALFGFVSSVVHLTGFQFVTLVVVCPRSEWLYLSHYVDLSKVFAKKRVRSAPSRSNWVYFLVGVGHSRAI